MVLYVSQYYLRSWRSWIARQTPTLKAVGSNPAERTIKSLQIQLDLETFILSSYTATFFIVVLYGILKLYFKK